MVKIIKKYDDTYIFDEEGVRFFLLIGEDKAMFIDSGMAKKDLNEYIKDITNKEVILVNTHADIDHVGGNESFDEVYLGINEINHYKKHNFNHQVNPLNDKDIIDLGKRKIEVINLEGHTSGSIALLDHKYNILFSGDSIQRNGRIFMFGEERDMHKYHLSLKRIKERENEFKEIWPCHSEIPVGIEMIDSLIEDSLKALNNELEAKEVMMHGMKIKALMGNNNTFLVN